MSRWAYLLHNHVLLQHVFTHTPPQTIVVLLPRGLVGLPTVAVSLPPRHRVTLLDALPVGFGPHGADHCKRRALSIFVLATVVKINNIFFVLFLWNQLISNTAFKFMQTKYMHIYFLPLEIMHFWIQELLIICRWAILKRLSLSTSFF